MNASMVTVCISLENNSFYGDRITVHDVTYRGQCLYMYSLP